MQSVEQFQGIKTDWCNNSDISVRLIFEDNHNWDVFYYNERDNIREIELVEVQKMMSCKDSERGFFVYHCPPCNEFRPVFHSI